MRATAFVFLSLLPCLVMFSESATVWPNLLGAAYTAMLLLFYNTRAGKRILKKANL